MANTIVALPLSGSNSGATVPIRAVDNGDGTYSLATAGTSEAVTSIKGAANIVVAQVTSTGTAATVAIARATRRSVLFTNTHATGSVWIGPATVTSANGQKLGPGQSCPFTWVGLYQVIDDNSTHCVVCVADEYD